MARLYSFMLWRDRHRRLPDIHQSRMDRACFLIHAFEIFPKPSCCASIVGLLELLGVLWSSDYHLTLRMEISHVFTYQLTVSPAWQELVHTHLSRKDHGQRRCPCGNNQYNCPRPTNCLRTDCNVRSILFP